MKLLKKNLWVAVALLLMVQAAQIAYVVHRESLTFDEDDHIFAGYMMLHTGDYGLNPEHPPLVKMLAALPLLGRNLWVPPLQGRDFKAEAYLDGRDFLARNDGSSQQLRLSHAPLRGTAGAGTLTSGLFGGARDWFGESAALIATGPGGLRSQPAGPLRARHHRHGRHVLLSRRTYAFYRYVSSPRSRGLLLAGVVAGLLLATKHSGILLAPMLRAAHRLGGRSTRPRASALGWLCASRAHLRPSSWLALWCCGPSMASATPRGLPDLH